MRLTLLCLLALYSPSISARLQVKASVSDHGAPVDLQASTDLLRRDDPVPRDVFVIADVWLERTAVSPKSGETLFQIHSAMHIAGNDQDGPMRIQLIIDKDPGNLNAMSINALDFTPENSGQPIGSRGPENTVRHVQFLGQTQLSNAELANQRYGTGLAVDAWMKDPIYRVGTADVNTCNNYVTRMAESMDLKIEGSMGDLFRKDAEFSRTFAQKTSYRVVAFLHDTLPKPGEEALGRWRIGWDVNEPHQPILAVDTQPRRDFSASYPDTDVRNPGHSMGPLPTMEEEWMSGPNPYADEAASSSGRSPPPPPPSPFACKRDAGLERRCETKEPTPVSEVAVGRVNGFMTTVRVVAKELAAAAGVVGALAAPVFVILDLVHGNWLGGAFGLVGLGFGIAATLALAGPVGWLIGGLIEALFAILPGLFSKPKPKPPRDNPAQIIQYAFFGDKDHTGNEKCREQGNPNCTAVYGPGVMSSVFKWNNFDSIAFLLHYNDGYPMTILDIAKAFYVMDYDKKTDDGKGKIATIGCGTPPIPNPRFSTPFDSKSCSDISFKLQRQLITLPTINQTADLVFNRIIPAPNGDCKLFNDAANGMKYPAYNMTVTGRPVGIACNISASLNIDGTAVPIDNPAATNGTIPDPLSSGNSSDSSGNSSTSVGANGVAPNLVSPGNSSTDGSGGHFVAAPPAVPFNNALINATNAICITGKAGSMCLPNGTYDQQGGSQGFNSRKADTLTMPAGANLTVIFTQPAASRFQPEVRQKPISFTTNQTANDKIFSMRMGQGDGPMNVTVSGPDAAPAVCLFSETDYKGDVFCLGPGGGNLTESQRNKAQSLYPHGNLTVWMYGEKYGDEGGVEVNTPVPDLAAEVYGSVNSFSKKIVALWIHPSI